MGNVSSIFLVLLSYRLHGSYEALKSGRISDCLTDLTGGLTETYTVRGNNADLPRNVVNIMFKSLERQSLIGCGINVCQLLIQHQKHIIFLVYKKYESY